MYTTNSKKMYLKKSALKYIYIFSQPVMNKKFELLIFSTYLLFANIISLKVEAIQFVYLIIKLSKTCK